MTEANQSEFEHKDLSYGQTPPLPVVVEEFSALRHLLEVESIDDLMTQEALLTQECEELNQQFDEVQAAFADIPSMPVDQVSDVIRELCKRQKGIWLKYSEVEEALGAVKEKLLQARNHQ